MKIEVLALGQLQTNCYLLSDNGEGIIIDPADEAEFIAEKIQRLKFKPKAIIATHGHFDHILAAGELQIILSASDKNSNEAIHQSLTSTAKNLPFYIHQNDLFLLKRMNQSASHWLGYPINKPLPNNIKFIKENEEIKLGNFSIKVLETPGHTPGSISLLLISTDLNRFPPISTIFSGDTLCKNGVGRYDFSYSSKEKLDQSLQKIFKLPGKTLVYPGHGGRTTLAEENY